MASYSVLATQTPGVENGSAVFRGLRRERDEAERSDAHQ
jgi:hypothetical protein